MLKKIYFSILIGSILTALYGCMTAQASTDIINYNMDSVAGITFLPSNSIAQQSSDNGNNVIRLNQTGSAFPIVRFPIANSSQYVAVEFDFKMSNTTGGGYVNIWDNAASNRALSLYINNAGFVFNVHENAPVIAAKYKADKWCHVKFVGNYSPIGAEQKLNLIIDGVVVAKGVTFRNQIAGKTMGRLDFDVRNNIDLLVDNVRVYVVTQNEYNTDYMVNQNFDGCLSVPSTFITAGANTTLENGYIKIYGADSLMIPIQNTSTKKFTLAFSIKTDGTAEKGIQFKNGTVGPHMYLRNNKLGFKPPNASYNDFFDLPVNSWNTIKIVVDCQSYLYNISVNDALILNNIPFRGNVDIVTSLIFIGSDAQTLYVDNIKMSASDLPEDAFYLTDSNPRNNGITSMINSSVTLNFNTIVYADKVSNNNFILTGGGTVPNINNITVSGKKIIIYYTDTFEYDKAYTLKLQDIQNTDGHALNPKIINFRTAQMRNILVSEPTFSLNGNEISKLANGKITVEISAKNTTPTTCNGIIIAALKKDSILKSIDCSESNPIDKVETKFQTEITVDDSENTSLEVYFWDGFSVITPYANTCVFDKNGVGGSLKNSPASYSEDFETPSSPVAALLKDYIITEDQNHVVKLKNGLTPVVGGNDWIDYRIRGKVKFKNKVLDGQLLRSAFEVVTRRRVLLDNLDAQATVTCSYNIGMNGAQDFLSIGGSAGHDIGIIGNDWADFSVIVSKNQAIFTVNGQTKYYYDVLTNGGFSFRASNCTVYLDDLEIEKTNSNGIVGDQIKALVPMPAVVAANQYDTVKISELSTVMVEYEDGIKEYISEENGLVWSIVQGNDLVELFEKDVIRFRDMAKEGDEVVLSGNYQNNTVRLTIQLTTNGKTNNRYIRDTMKKRQLPIFYLMREGLEADMSYDPSMYAVMGPRMRNIIAKMFLDPKEQNYDDEVKWMIEVSKWDLQQNGYALSQSDFYLMQLILLRQKLYGKVNVSQATWDMLDNYLKGATYCTEEYVLSENHLITYLAAGLVVSEMWKDNVMFNGKTGAENIVVYRNAIKLFLQRRLKYGWCEFDGFYVGTSSLALMFIFNWAQDAEAKQLATGALEAMVADSIMDSLDGFTVGARSRIKNGVYLEGGANFVTYLLTGQSVGNVKEGYSGIGNVIPMLLSAYTPSDVLLSIAVDRNKEYVHKERKQVFHLPDDESITESLKKYSYITQDYVLGAINQCDVVQGLVNLRKLDSKWASIGGTWVPQGHQEMPWSLYFGKTRDGLIFDSHPRGAETNGDDVHNYWTGDAGCLDYRYFQNENVILGMHKITKANELQFTHFYIPRSKFEKVAENKGWIFIKQGNVYAGIKPLKNGVVSDEPQYKWTTSGVNTNIEIKIDSPNTAFVCEVVSEKEYVKGFEQFQQDLMNNPLTYRTDDNYSIEYTGLNGKKMTLEYENNVTKVDGVAEDYGTYKLYDSPYMQSDWGSGVIDIMYKGKGVRINEDGEIENLGQ